MVNTQLWCEMGVLRRCSAAGRGKCECVSGVIVYTCVCEGRYTGVDRKWMYVEKGRVGVGTCAREEMWGRRGDGDVCERGKCVWQGLVRVWRWGCIWGRRGKCVCVEGVSEWAIGVEVVQPGQLDLFNLKRERKQ